MSSWFCSMSAHHSHSEVVLPAASAASGLHYTFSGFKSQEAVQSAASSIIRSAGCSSSLWHGLRSVQTSHWVLPLISTSERRFANMSRASRCFLLCGSLMRKYLQWLASRTLRELRARFSSRFLIISVSHTQHKLISVIRKDGEKNWWHIAFFPQQSLLKSYIFYSFREQFP